MNSLRRWEIVLLAVLTGAGMMWFAAPIVGSASANARLVDVFNVDEAYHVLLLQRAIERNSFALEFGNYGHLHFNLALIPLQFLNRIRPVTQREITWSLRTVPVVFGGATLLLTFLMARRLSGRSAAWIAALLLATVPLNFLAMAVTSHPDIPQCFFLLLSLECCSRITEDERRRWSYFASAAAGLAVACKYTGLLVLPLIVAAACLADRFRCAGTDRPTEAPRMARFTRIGVVTMAVAGLGTGILLTPAVAVRLFSPDGHIEDPATLRAMSTIRLALLGFAGTLMLVGLLRGPWHALGHSPRLATWLRVSATSMSVFGLAFFVGSPWSFYKLQFLPGLLYESAHTRFGHRFAGDPDGLQWLRLLLSRDTSDLFPMGPPILLDALLVGLSIMTLAGLVGELRARGWQRALRLDGVLWAWVLLYLGFLIARVRMGTARFLLPIIPPLILLATHALTAMAAALQRWMAGARGRILACVLVGGVLSLEVPERLHLAIEFRSMMRNRAECNPTLRAGDWIEAHYAPETRIYYDRYSYIPPTFHDILPTFGGTFDDVERFQPDLIVVSETASRVYADVGRARRYVHGPAAFMKKHAYYQSLADGSAGHPLVRDFGTVQIYGGRSAQSTGAP